MPTATATEVMQATTGRGRGAAELPLSPTTTTTTITPTKNSNRQAPPVRNQAPGIPDRRKSRLGVSRGGNRSSGISVRVSMADVSKKVKESDEEDQNESFEDAESTPRPASTDPHTSAGAPSTTDAKPESNGGLGVSGTPTADDSSVHADDGSRNGRPLSPVRPATSHSPPRDGSLSPRKLSSRQGSPVRKMHGLSGHVTAPMQPPPSTAERIHNLDQRHVGERVSSPTHQPPTFARKASTGFGALLGRMGSIRKPAKSPPGSRNGTFERRNTAASTASSDLHLIHDGAKLSLQDQFSTLRRQEEFSTSDSNDEDEKTPVASADRPETPSSPPKDGLRSPTLNPSLPPGTALGISVGPTTEPTEVNWDLWQQLVYEGPAALARTAGDELSLAIQSGIPPAIRGVVWQVLAESKNEELENVYRILKARGAESESRPSISRKGSSVAANGNGDKDAATSDASSDHSGHSAANSGIASPTGSVDGTQPDLKPNLLAEKQKRDAAALLKLEKAIKRDMGTRTSYSKYTQSAGLQDGLFGVCKAYALFDEGVGYAQGINFIAMPLLFNMGEEEAFTLLVRLMSKYDIRSMFTPDMTGLHLRLYQFERLLEEYEPAVYCHLKRRHVTPQLYATQWFLTLFAYRFPLQLVLRIYDLILGDGLVAILKFGIVLMQHNRQALLEMKDMSHLTNFLKERLFDVYIDKSPSASSLLDSGFFGSVTGGADKELYRADDMVRDACSVKISEDTLKAYTLEWEELQRTERERETEIEHLRLTNIALTSKVKTLEERVQQNDSEHVNIAQDLVKVKLENDSLLDSNEALKLQVTELQKMVDTQPAEVESRLKEEMDRIMKRNIEVQNENRAIKEEMDEMEHELVNAKVAHAQTQSDYDAMKQKWSSVQALLNDKQ